VIRPFGEAALLVEVDDARAARAFAETLAERPVAGVVAALPGRRSVLVELDAGADPEATGAVLGRLARGARSVDPDGARLRRIPVAFGGEHGPDLETVAHGCGLTPDALVDRLLSVELEVLFLGFAPGFAYLGDLPADLVVPRLATPRTRTPAGSVAIADGLAGIYPAELPGGWPVVGATPLVLFDPHRVPPTYLGPGDRVRWERLTAPVGTFSRTTAVDW
jgi:KipI family sensor histidine kinase inhibitor